MAAKRLRLLVVAAVFLAPALVLAETYGSGTYNEGVFNVGEVAGTEASSTPSNASPGGIVIRTTPVFTSAPASALSALQIDAILQLLASFGAEQSVIEHVTAALSGASASSGTFIRDLKLGSTGEDVRRLQQYLNVHGFTLAASGPGSPGNETDRFGALTRAALTKFQAAKGIIPAAGYFGPKTRAVIGL